MLPRQAIGALLSCQEQPVQSTEPTATAYAILEPQPQQYEKLTKQN